MVINNKSISRHAPPPAEAGRRQRRHEETMEKLFTAAMELFSRKGFTQTTVEEITQAADVGKGTFFNYFPSKEHVLGYFVAKQKGTVMHHLELAREAKMSSKDVLASLGRSLVRIPAKSPQMASCLLRVFFGNAEVRECMVGEMTEGRRGIAEILQLGQERGELSNEFPPSELARAFHHALFGTVLMWVLDSSNSVEKRLGNTMKVLFSGIETSSMPSRSTRPELRSRAAKNEREAR
jgi:AcrR family transcriptional regulator